MIWITLALYLAGMAPTWGIVQTGNLLRDGKAIEDRWVSNIVIIFWPIIGLYVLPTLIRGRL